MLCFCIVEKALMTPPDSGIGRVSSTKKSFGFPEKGLVQPFWSLERQRYNILMFDSLEDAQSFVCELSDFRLLISPFCGATSPQCVTVVLTKETTQDNWDAKHPSEKSLSKKLCSLGSLCNAARLMHSDLTQHIRRQYYSRKGLEWVFSSEQRFFREVSWVVENVKS